MMRVFNIYLVLVCVFALTADIKAERDLQSSGYEPPQCGITGFSVYNASSKTSTPLKLEQYVSEYPEGKLLLDKYPNKLINIIANTSTVGCPVPATTIRCVKIKFGTFASSKEVKSPYTLYKSNIRGQVIGSGQIPTNVSGFTPLEAWAYTSSNCTTSSLINYFRADVQIVPKTIERFTMSTYATYNNVNSSLIKPIDVSEVINKTCANIRESFDYGYTYKGALYVHSYFCVGKLATQQPAKPSIYYIVEISFGIGEEISMYSNPNMPKQSSIVQYFQNLLLDKVGQGPGCEGIYLSTVVKSTMNKSNPFIKYSTITLNQTRIFTS